MDQSPVTGSFQDVQDKLSSTRLPTLDSYGESRNLGFQFGFSQMPGILPATSTEAADASMEDNSSSSEQFALNFSQLVETDAMTQI